MSSRDMAYDAQKEREEEDRKAAGWKSCAYCGELRAPEDLKPEVLFFRERKPDHRGRLKMVCSQRTNLYCKDRPCHSNDQCAHEG